MTHILQESVWKRDGVAEGEMDAKQQAAEPKSRKEDEELVK